MLPLSRFPMVPRTTPARVNRTTKTWTRYKVQVLAVRFRDAQNASGKGGEPPLSHLSFSQEWLSPCQHNPPNTACLAVPWVQVGKRDTLDEGRRRKPLARTEPRATQAPLPRRTGRAHNRPGPDRTGKDRTTPLPVGSAGIATYVQFSQAETLSGIPDLGISAASLAPASLELHISRRLNQSDSGCSVCR